MVKYDFKKVEEEVLKFWEQNKIPADEISWGDIGLSFPLPGPLHIAPGTP